MCICIFYFRNNSNLCQRISLSVLVQFFRYLPGAAVARRWVDVWAAADGDDGHDGGVRIRNGVGMNG